MVGQPIEHGGGHLGFAEHLRLTGKGEIDCDQQRRVLIELTDQAEEQLAPAHPARSLHCSPHSNRRSFASLGERLPNFC
jgi:hypothetical protein